MMIVRLSGHPLVQDSLRDPLERGFRCFFKCINLFLKLVFAFDLVVLWSKFILSLCPFERSGIIEGVLD